MWQDQYDGKCAIRIQNYYSIINKIYSNNLTLKLPFKAHKLITDETQDSFIQFNIDFIYDIKKTFSLPNIKY